MSEHKLEDMKGRVEEAVGTLTDNRELQLEGKIDQAAAAAKSRIDKAGDKIKDVVVPKS